jgi:hypothetical protein
MTKTGSALTSEMVGPAGSTSEGAFSRTKSGEEDDVCPPPDALAGLLLEDWARAAAGARLANRQNTAADRTAEDGNALNVMKNPASF